MHIKFSNRYFPGGEFTAPSSGGIGNHVDASGHAVCTDDLCGVFTGVMSKKM